MLSRCFLFFQLRKRVRCAGSDLMVFTRGDGSFGGLFIKE